MAMFRITIFVDNDICITILVDVTDDLLYDNTHARR